ncbi:MAG TPA: choice-of-anchor Q domain-containing protein [Lacipirellulaceae bacterium]|nr:choice-of-anchor Q domain-containing protein [Lacipirellulaceae bacterium]
MAARIRPLRFQHLEQRALLATLVVNSPLDLVDPYDDMLTLREAVSAASILPGPDTITFAPELNGSRIVLQHGAITAVGSSLSIDASSLNEGITIDGGAGDPDRPIERQSVLFRFDNGNYPDRVVSLTNLTLTGGGTVSEMGGAVVVYGGTLSMSRCHVLDNYCADGAGGIGVVGTAVLIDCTISDNEGGLGGGVYVLGSADLRGCTLFGNSAGTGGGAWLQTQTPQNQIRVYNSTITGNSVFSGGSGIAGSEMMIESCTIAENVGQLTSAGVESLGGNVVIRNSIVAGNLAQASVGAILSNLQVDPNQLILAYSFIGWTQDAGLGPLGDYGGPTQTMPLFSYSPAINAGDPAALAGVGGQSLFDQRGAPFGRVSGGRLDMGAFEVQAATADFNSDQSVDGHDFLLWQRGLGTPAPQGARTDGDADGDLDVDHHDLAVWMAQFGQPALLPSAVSSPPVQSARAVHDGAVKDAVLTVGDFTTLFGGDGSLGGRYRTPSARASFS